MATKTLNASLAASEQASDFDYFIGVTKDGVRKKMSKTDLAQVAGGLKYYIQGSDVSYIHVNLTKNQSICLLFINNNGSDPGTYYILLNAVSRIVDNGAKIYRGANKRDIYIEKLSGYGAISAYLSMSTIEILTKEQFDAVPDKTLVQ